MEKFVREELEDFVNANADGTSDDVKNQRMMIEHFGEFYAKCPKKFRFLPGDRKFVQMIQNHIHGVVEKKGRKRAFQHFSSKVSRKDAIKYTSDKMNENDRLMDSKSINAGLKTKLYNLISDKLIELGVPLSTITLFDESFIQIAEENDKITGNVLCVACHLESKHPESVKPKQVFCRGKSWVISNFIKHLKRAHCHRSPDENNDSKHPNMGNELIENENPNDEYMATEYVKVETIDQITYELDYSTDSMNNFVETETTAMEKKLNAQITKQLIQMWNVVTLNGEYQDLQVRSVYTNGITVSLDAAKIAKDGNCMYGSLAHQILGHSLNSVEHELATNQLRIDVVNYIRQNFEQFRFQICSHISDLEEVGLDKSLGLHEIGDIDDKCKYLLNNHLVKSGFWGSGESLKAVAYLHSVNIIVFYENGPLYCVAKEGKLSERTVLIAFNFIVIQ